MKPGDIFAQGKYTLLRKLRSSGMAEVWLARQHGTEGFAKDVVLKRILPHLAEDDKLITMFLDEARIAANLNHPNVVQIFDLGSDGVNYFIAMEYIRGHDLEQIQEHLKKRHIPFPVEYAVRMIADTCLGLAYAHDCTTSDGSPMNVVHRDVSPQNVLVSETGVVKLIDFGIAKARTSSTRTQVGHTKGKICYMSPEQMMARDLDRRSDIFSAGVVLYEALCGIKPFDGDNLLACFHKLMKEGIAYPRQLRPDLSPELERIIMKALAKDREERYPTATAFRRDLEKFLRNEGISVGPEHLADFLKWLFTPPESTQVVLDLPRVIPVQAQHGQRPLSSPSVPVQGLPNAHGRTFGTEDRVPAAQGGRVTSSSRAPAPHAGRRTMSSGHGNAFVEETVMEESTVMEEPTVLDPRQTSAKLQQANSGFYQGAPQAPMHGHTGPSMGAPPSHLGGSSQLTGPSMVGSMNFDIGEEHEHPYSRRRKRESKGSSGWIFGLMFFVLLAGGAVAAHFLGFLSDSKSKNPVERRVLTPPPRIVTPRPEPPRPDAGAKVEPRPVRRQPVRPRPIVRRPVRRRPTRRRPPRRRPRGFGYLIIDTDIRARVSIDGSLNYVRVPMLNKKRVKAGWHKLRFISPVGSRVKRIYVSPNRTKDIYVRLR